MSGLCKVYSRNAPRIIGKLARRRLLQSPVDAFEGGPRFSHLMRWNRILLICATLLVPLQPALAGPKPAKADHPLLQSKFGAEVHSLQLALTVSKSGRDVVFQVRNRGKKAVQFTESYSCSGFHSWWIVGGETKADLSHRYAYEPELKGLTTSPLRTACTVNIPAKLRIAKPGKTVEISIAFAKKERLPQKGDVFFQGKAAIQLRDSHQLVELESPVVKLP